jgi:hypothetical protein
MPADIETRMAVILSEAKDLTSLLSDFARSLAVYAARDDRMKMRAIFAL